MRGKVAMVRERGGNGVTRIGEKQGRAKPLKEEELSRCARRMPSKVRFKKVGPGGGVCFTRNTRTNKGVVGKTVLRGVEKLVVAVRNRRARRVVCWGKKEHVELGARHTGTAVAHTPPGQKVPHARGAEPRGCETRSGGGGGAEGEPHWLAGSGLCGRGRAVIAGRRRLRWGKRTCGGLQKLCGGTHWEGSGKRVSECFARIWRMVNRLGRLGLGENNYAGKRRHPGGLEALIHPP
ncbi:hypothetical protein Tco_0000108 [Tanacetum coccineum]